MPKIDFTCGSCHHKVKLNVGQVIDNRKIGWYGSYVCSNCGDMEERDDRGLPSQDIREVILKEEGEYKIFTDDIKGKIKVLKVLKKTFDIPLPELTYFSKKIPGIFLEGTKTEMEWIQQLLSAEGVNTNIIKSTANNSEMKIL
jgi:hypothetical protein